MRITFDPNKNARNIVERSLSFERVADLDWETAVAVEDDRRDYGERRLRVMGRLGPRFTSRSSRIAATRCTSSVSARPILERSSVMPTKKLDAASRPDDENPEWTREDLKRARPAPDLIGELFGAEAAEVVAQRRGRPRKPAPKINQTLRLDADVVDAYRRQGRGWQTRINAVLRAHMNDRGK
jgi:uncharacterized protein (DUF4415 family)